MDRPLTVELVNQSDWWLPWLPVLGSLIVAAAAFVGVAVNNRTNRAAIVASDRRAREDRHDTRTRDFLAWQRDTILETAAAVVQAAVEAQEEGMQIAYGRLVEDSSALGGVAQMGQTIGAASAKLRIIGAHDLAAKCRDIRNVMNSHETVGAMLAMNSYQAAKASGAQGAPDRESELRSDLDAQLERINQARGRFGEAAEAALRQTTELPTEELDDVRPRRFGRRS